MQGVTKCAGEKQQVTEPASVLSTGRTEGFREVRCRKVAVCSVCRSMQKLKQYAGNKT